MLSKKRLFSIAAVSFTLAALAATPALACSSGGGGVWLINHGNGVYWVQNHRVSIVEIELMDICVVGVNSIPGVIGVDEAAFVDPQTGEVFATLTFEPSEQVSKLLTRVAPVLGRDIEGLPEVNRWHGFIGRVDGEIPPGLELDLMFHVRVDPSVETHEFARNLNNVGLFAMGALDSNGLPVVGHFEVNRPMEIEPMEEIGETALRMR